MGPRTPAPSWRPCPTWSSWSSPGSAAETSRPTHSPAEEPLIGAVNKSGIIVIQKLLACRYDNLRDQIKEKDDYKYKYDNSTSEVCAIQF